MKPPSEPVCFANKGDSEENMAADLVQDKFKDLLERSMNGLEWYKDEHPHSWSEADEEHLSECREFLASI